MTIISHDVIQQQQPQPQPPSSPLQTEKFSIEEISSPINPQIFKLCDPELFPETLQNSEVTSSSNCCYNEISSYAENMSLVSDIDNNFNTSSNLDTAPTSATTTSTTTTAATNPTNSSNLSIIFDSQDEIDDISASIDFSSSPSFSVHPYDLVTSQQDQNLDFCQVQPQVQVQLASSVSVLEALPQYPTDPVVPDLVAPPLLPSVFEDDSLSSVLSYVPLSSSSPSCSYYSPGMGAYLTAGVAGPVSTAMSAERSATFCGSILLGHDVQAQKLEFQGENGGIYCPDSLQKVFNPPDLQAICTESQQLVAVTESSTTLRPEISNLEDSTFKVGKLSAEQRKEKIHRYLKKRNERNFSKKIKYACRKTLADSRPRVRGRFAKNDDFRENHRDNSNDHGEDDEEVVVKAQDDMVDSSDIFAHISGVNSFKCNYSFSHGFDFIV